MLKNFFNEIADIFTDTKTTYVVSFCRAIYDAIRFKTECILLEYDILVVTHLGVDYIIEVTESEDNGYIVIFTSVTSTIKAKYDMDRLVDVLVNAKPLTELEIISQQGSPVPTKRAHNITKHQSNPQENTQPITTQQEVQQPQLQEVQQQQMQLTTIPELDPVVSGRENEADNIFIQAAARQLQRELAEIELRKEQDDLLRRQYDAQMEMAQVMYNMQNNIYNQNMHNNYEPAYTQFNMNDYMPAIMNLHGIPQDFSNVNTVYDDGIFAIQ